MLVITIRPIPRHMSLLSSNVEPELPIAVGDGSGVWAVCVAVTVGTGDVAETVVSTEAGGASQFVRAKVANTIRKTTILECIMIFINPWYGSGLARKRVICLMIPGN